jgi:hypothetical protein
VPEGHDGPTYDDVAHCRRPYEGGGDDLPRQQDASSTQWPSEPDPKAQELFDAMLTDIGDKIDVSSLRVWFDGIVAMAFGDGALTIEVPNSFAKEYVESRFGALLLGTLRARVREDAVLKVVTRPAAE